MDTKARIAVIVGGVVLVGMVAWVLMPGDKAEVPVDTPEPIVDSTQVPAAPADEFAATTMPTTAPFGGVDPFASTTTLPAPTVDIGPSLTPADSTTDAWSRALDGGAPADRATNAIRQPVNDAFSANFSNPGGLSPTTNHAGATVIPAAPVLSGTPKTYSIASGDSLYTISERIYGNSKYVNKIIAANPGINPSRLKVGQQIKLPDVSETSTPSLSSTVTSSVGSSSAASASSASTYKVQAGDSLRKISTKVYGDAGKWEKIYSANRSMIGSDPSRIRAGMVLQIPAN